MPLNCIYHKDGEMRVVSSEERDKLVNSGEWFDRPNFENDGEDKNEKPIHAKEKRKFDASVKQS